MGTLIICSKNDCMYAKKRSDDFFHCSCTTIGVNQDKECDTYMVFPICERKILTEIVDEIITDLSGGDKLYFRNTKKDNLIRFHHGFGTSIRNKYKLWTKPPELLKDMGLAKDAHADDISMEIIKAVWKKLKEDA